MHFPSQIVIFPSISGRPTVLGSPSGRQTGTILLAGSRKCLKCKQCTRWPHHCITAVQGTHTSQDCESLLRAFRSQLLINVPFLSVLFLFGTCCDKNNINRPDGGQGHEEKPMPMSRQPMPKSRQPMPMSRQPMPMSRQPMPMSRQPMPMSRQPMPMSRQD